MPIFAALISSSLTWFVTFFAARLSTRLALLAGVMAVSLAGFVAAKAAVFALASALTFVVPPSILAPISYAMPSNLVVCITAVFVSDAIYEAYSLWTAQLGHVSRALFA
jgi:hypothetical protein